jgi:hypothetical protein
MQMSKRAAFIAVFASSSVIWSGCENLPGDDKSQGAVIGGVTGAAVGAAVGGERHRVLGAILGGALGAGGGYVIGANKDKIIGNDKESAEKAARQSESDPATPEEALRATTADVNNDGFVTLDEVVALEKAGLTDAQILERLRLTNQIFELTDEQKRYLSDRGVGRTVVDQLNEINREQREQVIGSQQGVISRER